MDKTIVEYLAVLVHSGVFVLQEQESKGDVSLYRMNPSFGLGTLKILTFGEDAFFVFLADFTPKETIDRFSVLSEKYLEISQFETGNGMFKPDGRKWNTVDKGIYFHLNTEQTVRIYCEANRPVKFTRIILTRLYYDRFFKNRYEDFKDSGLHLPENHLTRIQNTPELNLIFQQIRECQMEGPLLPIYLESKVLELLSCLLSDFTSSDTELLSVTLSRKDKKNLQKCVSFMKKDLSRHLDGKELARLALMSPARFQLAFRKYYGKAPYAYFKALRLNQSLIYLKNTDYSIKTVAEKVGYRHGGHFAKVFREAYGMSPGKYRKMICK